MRPAQNERSGIRYYVAGAIAVVAAGAVGLGIGAVYSDNVIDSSRAVNDKLLEIDRKVQENTPGPIKRLQESIYSLFRRGFEERQKMLAKDKGPGTIDDAVK